MASKNNSKKLLLGILVLLACGVIAYYAIPSAFSLEYNSSSPSKVLSEAQEGKKPADIIEQKHEEKPEISASAGPSSNLPVIHIKTPEHVRAIYMSAWVAGSAKYRNPLVKMLDDTELNSVVIDVKDSTGRISFYMADPEIKQYGAMENRISDIRAITNMLHQKGVYIIGRVAVFQDPYMTKLKPEWSITKKSDGKVWKDRKGLSFLDPTSKDVHKYVVAIARDAYDEGFDEINFDYIRYPSDGDLKDINYNLAKDRTRSDNIEDFFKYLHTEVKKGKDIPISGDLFGLTTEVADDMGIGQVWVKALPHFDFLSPMVYPSHYPAGKGGFKNPADHPYEIINTALVAGIAKTKALGEPIAKIRPWLQDFNLGAKYTKEMIRLEMKAVYDNKLDSWMLWDPANKYTPSALELETNQ